MVNYSPAILDNLIIQHDNHKRVLESLIEFIEYNQKTAGIHIFFLKIFNFKKN